MHPGVDVEKVMKQSYQGENQAASTRAWSQAGSQVADHSQQTYVPHAQPGSYPPASMIDHNGFGQMAYTTNPDPFGEGDLYDGGQTTSTSYPQQFQHQHLGVGPQSASHMHSTGFQPSVTVGNSNYASSNTMPVATTTPQDPTRPLLAHREVNFPMYPYIGQVMTNQTRPMDVHTASPFGQTSDEFSGQYPEWNPNADASSAIDGSMQAIDPSLGALQSGSWDLASQASSYPTAADIPDQQAQSGLSLPPEEQQPVNPDINQRQSEIFQQLMAIIQPLSPEDMRLMVETYNKHPDLPNKTKCTMRSV